MNIMTHKAIKQTLLAAVCLLLTVGANATDDKEYKYFIRNDKHVCYCTSGGVTVIVDPSPAGICQPVITIINESGNEFVFEPRDIKAYTYGIPKQKDIWERRHVKMWFDCGYSTDKLERDSLEVFSYEKYRRITSRTQWWGAFISNVILSAADGAVANDNNGLYWMIGRSERRSEQSSMQRNQILKQIDDSYWRTNTIFDGEEHHGFIVIKESLSDQLVLQIPVNGELFEFFVQDWK